jgi:hypothetical protein
MYNEHLSANTLFNFTKEFTYLKSKIENRFKPRLVLENYAPLNIPIEKAIPMVCFCDIRLSDILIHIEEYGDYGIGLKKEWGINKKLNPLVYVPSEHSFIIELFSKLVNKDSQKDAAKFFINFKPYAGEQNGKNRNFYNEREWRFVPDVDIDTYSLDKQDFEITDKREKINSHFFDDSEKGLDFGFNDIKYIVLKNPSEKQDIVDVIVDVFSVKEVDVYKNIIIITKEIIEKDL